MFWSYGLGISLILITCSFNTLAKIDCSEDDNKGNGSDIKGVPKKLPWKGDEAVRKMLWNGMDDDTSSLNTTALVDIHECPFVVSIHVLGRFQCVGSLYSFRTVITTANCLQLFYNYRFYHDHKLDVVIKFLSNYTDGISVPGLEIFFHPNYDPDTLDWNAALIRLKYDIYPINGYPQTIKVRERKNPVPINTWIWFYGWGSERNFDVVPGRTTFGSRTLVRHGLRIYPLDECGQIYSDYPPQLHHASWQEMRYVTDRNFCAGDNITTDDGDGALDRDVGAPAVYKDELYGLVSHRWPSCNVRLDAPTVFVHVGAMNLWIKSIDANLPGYKSVTVAPPKKDCKHLFDDKRKKRCEEVPDDIPNDLIQATNDFDKTDPISLKIKKIYERRKSDREIKLGKIETNGTAKSKRSAIEEVSEELDKDDIITTEKNEPLFVKMLELDPDDETIRKPPSGMEKLFKMENVFKAKDLLDSFQPGEYRNLLTRRHKRDTLNILDDKKKTIELISKLNKGDINYEIEKNNLALQRLIKLYEKYKAQNNSKVSKVNETSTNNITANIKSNNITVKVRKGALDSAEKNKKRPKNDIVTPAIVSNEEGNHQQESDDAADEFKNDPKSNDNEVKEAVDKIANSQIKDVNAPEVIRAPVKVETKEDAELIRKKLALINQQKQVMAQIKNIIHIEELKVNEKYGLKNGDDVTVKDDFGASIESDEILRMGSSNESQAIDKVVTDATETTPVLTTDAKTAWTIKIKGLASGVTKTGRIKRSKRKLRRPD